jgi:hypothetical protein
MHDSQLSLSHNAREKTTYFSTLLYGLLPPTPPYLLTINNNASWDNNNHRDPPVMEESRKGYYRRIQSRLKMTAVSRHMGYTTSARQTPTPICLSIRLSIGRKSFPGFD